MKKKSEPTRKPRSKLDFDALPPAIVDGKLVANKEQQLVFKRQRRNKEIITFVQIVNVSETGDISLYDDTLGQCTGFNINTDLLLLDKLRIYS